MPSAGPVLAAPPLETATEWAEELDRAGYAEFLACFEPAVLSPSAWRSARPGLAPELGAVVDLFLLGQAVRPSDLPSGLRRLAPGLAAAGLLTERADGLVAADGIIVLHVGGVW